MVVMPILLSPTVKNVVRQCSTCGTGWTTLDFLGGFKGEMGDTLKVFQVKSQLFLNSRVVTTFTNCH